MKKRCPVLSIFLSIALVIGLCPGLAFAIPQDVADTPIEAQAGNIAEGTWGTCPWEISSDWVLTVHPGVGEDCRFGDRPFPWSGYRWNIKKIVFAEENGKKVIAPKDCTSLLSYEQLDSWNTKDPLVQVDLSGLDTSKVWDMLGMFSGCSSLTSLDLSGFDTSRVEDMEHMFKECYSLISLDLSSFDTGMAKSFVVGPLSKYKLSLYDCRALSEFSLGEETVGLRIPTLNYVDGHWDWYSLETGAWITADQIESSRLGMPDTYVKTVPGAPSKPSQPSTPNIPGTPVSPTPDDPGTTDPKPDDPGTTDPGAADPEPVATETMYRLYNPNSGEHFYTSSPVERQAVIDAGWNDEGVGWTAPTEGIKVYRLYNSFAGEHHYTTSEAERDMLVSVGWTWEEGGWFSDPNESVPLYRAYNPNAYANNHHYTLDWGEFQTLLGLGWQDEGVGWYGVR